MAEKVIITDKRDNKRDNNGCKSKDGGQGEGVVPSSKGISKDMILRKR